MLALMGVMLIGYAVFELSAWIHVWRWNEVYAEALKKLSGDPWLLSSAQALGIVSVLAIALRWTERDHPWSATLNLQPLRFSSWALLFMFGMSLQLPLSQIAHIVSWMSKSAEPEYPWLDTLLQSNKIADWLKLALFLSVIPPLTEEFFFRGWMQPRLGLTYGWRGGWVISSLLFGMTHGSLSSVVYATTAGLVLGAAAIVQGSTWASIAVHAGVNTLPILARSPWLPIEGFNQGDSIRSLVWISPPWLIGSIMLALILWLAQSRQTRSTS